MKDDEYILLRELFLEKRALKLEDGSFAGFGPYPSETAKRLGMHPKRLNYILEKWTDKDWWEYGVSPQYGWMTDEGHEAAMLEMLQRGDIDESGSVK